MWVLQTAVSPFAVCHLGICADFILAEVLFWLLAEECNSVFLGFFTLKQYAETICLHQEGQCETMINRRPIQRKDYMRDWMYFWSTIS